MPVSPTGRLIVPLHQLADLIVASSSWQAWCGDANTAAGAVYLIAAPNKAPLPHALIDHDPSFARTRDGVSAGRFKQSGSLQLYVADLARHKDSRDAVTDFGNRLDLVLADLEEAPNEGGYGLVIDAYTISAGPQRMPAAERDKYGDIIEVILAIDITVHP